MKPLRSDGGDSVRGETDDGDIELVFCGMTVCASKLCATDFGECMSLDRKFEPGDICIKTVRLSKNQLNEICRKLIVFFLVNNVLFTVSDFVIELTLVFSHRSFSFTNHSNVLKYPENLPLNLVLETSFSNF